MKIAYHELAKSKKLKENQIDYFNLSRYHDRLSSFNGEELGFS